MAQYEINSENGAQETAWSEELERLPLKQRLKLLLARRPASFDSEMKVQNCVSVPPPCLDEAAADKKFGFSGEEQMTVSREERNEDDLGECRNEGGLVQKCNASQVIAAAAAISVDSSLQKPLFSQRSAAVRIENFHDVVSPPANYVNGFPEVVIRAVKSEPEMSIHNEFDHVVLKERLRWLLESKKTSGLKAKVLKENSACVSLSGTATNHLHTAGILKGEPTSGYQSVSVSGKQICEDDRFLNSGAPEGTLNFACKSICALDRCFEGNRLTCAIDSSDSAYSSKNNCSKDKVDSKEASLSMNTILVKQVAVPKLASIKSEPLHYHGFLTSDATRAGEMSFMESVPVKTDVENPNDSCEDELDHMLLRERMELFSSRYEPNLNVPRSLDCTSKVFPSSFGCRSVPSRPAESLKVSRPRKRRKTVTDSVETAMEEDAPGLLPVLIEKGVSVNEIKLYGEPECNDALDDSSAKDDFAELEAIISKLFSRRESLLRFAPFKCAKRERASYCLECLLSLVEQARYLQFRNWPVEWGWCRDLQSFIFVFEKHNRIVLERPEYGYATYFFELADSLPIDWQIKRLVTAMKLTTCSRINLIENKALVVGDDLTEGEARVLMEYGWIPNTGLGTMLHYCDRVVHDRKNEKESSEWRSKIGKLLVDGYNGGTIIPAGIPTKVVEYEVSHPLEVKLELN